MRQLIRAISAVALLLAASAPALASRHPADAPRVFVDKAAIPTYPIETIAPLRKGWRHHARRTEPRHRAERAAPKRRKPVERAKAEAHRTAPRPPSNAMEAALEAAQAAKLGALLGIVGGFEDGITTSIGESVAALAEAVETEAARAYLGATACPGYTMERQGVDVSIGRLNPIFARRLAAANREAREDGIEVCVFSAYRPPSFGIGGFRDKFESAHAYGLAVDQGGLDGPGSRTAVHYREIAARHGVYGPYSVFSRAEYNHFQPTKILLVADAAPLRRTITADGPRSLDRMWEIADAIIAPAGLSANIAARRERHRRWARRHYASR